MIKFKPTSIKFYLNTNVDFAKVIIHKYLIALSEKRKKSVDNGGAFGALLPDLSKAFDCLFNELLTAKLYTYELHKKSLVLIYSYLSNRKKE